MAGQVQIDLCKSSEVAAVMQFIDTHWRSGHILSRDEQLFRWQFAPQRLVDNDGDHLPILLAHYEGQIVGMLGLIPFDLNVFGETGRGIWTANWLALPEMRNKAVGLQLMEAAKQVGPDGRFAVGLGAQVVGLYRLLRWNVADRTPRWVTVLDQSKAQTLLMLANPDVPVDSIDACTRRYAVANDESYPGSVEVTQSESTFDAQWDALWRARIAPKFICAARDADYLNWRYVNHPQFDYRVLVAKDASNGDWLGMAIYRFEAVRDTDFKGCRIVEFLAVDEARDALAAEVVRQGREAGAAFADFYCSSTQVAQPLEHAGFRRHGDEEKTPIFPSLFQPLAPVSDPIASAYWLDKRWHEKVGSLLDCDGFYVTKADGDMDRPN